MDRLLLIIAKEVSEILMRFARARVYVVSLPLKGHTLPTYSLIHTVPSLEVLMERGC